MLLPGDPAPVFTAPSSVNPKFHFDTVAGRYVVLCFFASSQHPFSQRLLAELEAHQERFDVANAVFFGVSVDPADRDRLTQQWPGVMYFWDFDLSISRQYGRIGEKPADGLAGADNEKTPYLPCTMVLDQALRVAAIMPFGGEPQAYLQQVLSVLDQLPRLSQVGTPAPVLVIPHVFERDLCNTLIDYYQAHGGEDSGFMRDINGKTVGVTDYSHKRRADCEIVDNDLIRKTQERISRRVVPAIRQAFQFNANRIERHIVACYDGEQGGHFRAHRDNTTLGTAHRRFAVTINLNAEGFEGGELWFPEFSRTRYRAPTGGAVVFSCSLLHEATPVTRGKRFAFLPFLYDDAAAQIRQRNRQFIADTPPVTVADGSASGSSASETH